MTSRITSVYFAVDKQTWRPLRPVSASMAAPWNSRLALWRSKEPELLRFTWLAPVIMCAMILNTFFFYSDLQANTGTIRMHTGTFVTKIVM